jgi:hypothetical protein
MFRRKINLTGNFTRTLLAGEFRALCVIEEKQSKDKKSPLALNKLDKN